MKKRLTAIIMAATAIGVSAQRSRVHETAQTEYNAAMQLYDAEMWGASRSAFAQFIENWNQTDFILSTDAKYFHAVSAKRLNNNDAPGLMTQFIRECKQSIRRHDMYYHLGDYYLINESERQALKWFEKADYKKVDPEHRNDLLFKTGYCYFVTGKRNKALSYFDRLKGTSQYESAVKYYKAHVDYENGSLNEALKTFLELEKDAGFSNVAPYYIAHIFYLQGHYTEAIRYAEPLTQTKGKKAIEMVRIVADGHFMIEEYQKAATNYERLQSLTKNMNRADYYHTGMCYYHLGKYNEASNALSKVTGEKDELSQNAYYHLAGCYLQANDKKRARTAFEAASKYDFDKAIKEDAHFNKLKLAYELNFTGFNEIVSDFIEFVDTYPKSDKVDEAYDYISKALVTTKNYKQALATMEKIQHKNLKIYTAMQRLSFYRGLELYTNLNFNEATEFFDYSLQYGDYDKKLKARAYYWKGECLYRTNNQYAAAEQQYMNFINAYSSSELDEFTTAHYNIAYTHFNRRKYAEARKWFLKYVGLYNTVDKRLISDAYNRLGDCMYVQRDYKPAIEYYDLALKTSSQVGDYAMLQKGICLGLTKDNKGKITQLKTLIQQYPKSQYCANAYYEIARAHVAMDEIKDAIYNYKVVKEKYPKGSLAAKAMVQLGLLYYNASEYDNSMAFYKRVINEYPSTSDASDALAGLRNVYMELGDFDGYLAYTNTLGSFAKLELHEQDSLMFTSAARIYLKGDMENAKPALQKYLNKFGDGRFVMGANFYLGECYYSEGNNEQALTSYEYVAEQARNIFTEDALLRTGELYYKADNYEKAFASFQRLENEAEVETNKVEAIIGQMRCLEKAGDAASCVASADKVIDMPQASPEIMREAKYLKVKSLITLHRTTEAIPTLRELSENTKSAEGAEAKYLIAQAFFDQNDIENAEKEVFDYVEQGTPHQYWLARSFILLADIYHQKEDDFQARQYLESLSESYSADDDISDMISQRLSAWKVNTATLPD
ncbi:MAG: tetratricopeptide repeat protein [Bacteroidales bacterium]|nr:tetratricopeptide repeat protein [Bacteroidales bacterium]